jgi:hypothetical protein
MRDVDEISYRPRPDYFLEIYISATLHGSWASRFKTLSLRDALT